MDEQLQQIAEILEDLLEDLPQKAKDQLSQVVDSLKKSPNGEELMKIQDDLESISNIQNLDSFSRNEIMNIVTEIEGIYNS